MSPFRIALIVIGLIAAIAIPSLLTQQRESAVDAFADEIPTYLAIWNGGVDTGNAPAQSAIVGPMVAIDPATEAVDPFHFDLPGDIRATAPADVRSILFLKCWTTDAGYYLGGPKAEHHACEFVAYDRQTQRVTLRETMENYAPLQITDDQSGTATRPTAVFLERLAELTSN